jgi:outer membrane receptor protein involved in Fe transport
MLSAGARYDNHEKFSHAFSPRLAWTKVFDRLHLKAICSRSFRAPGIDNLDANPDLRPEKAKVLEFEAGYKFLEDLFISASVYDIKIDKPIVFYIENSSQTYGNYGKTGTTGFELTSRLKKDWGYADFSYSYYTAPNNGVAFYDAGADSSSLLAFARDKFTLSASIRLSPDFSVNPSAVYYAGRRGYYAAGRTRSFDDIMLANIYFSRKNLLSGRMELGLGVYDVFNSGYGYIQPYNGGHAPLPGPSREIRARASYRF